MQIRKHLENFLLTRTDGKSVAVVGNARLNEKFADEIDKYNEIIRFNEYHITPETKKYLGTRTTLWVMASTILRNHHGHLMALTPRIVMPKNYKYKPDIVIEPDKNYERELLRKHNHLAPPSTGILFLYILDILGITATAFNFDFLQTNTYYKPLEMRSKVHTVESEKFIAKKLKNITFYGQCD